MREREENRDGNDLQSVLASEKEVNVFLKRQPAFFVRMNENANRLFFDSHQRLKELEDQSAAERRRYKTTEVALVILVIASVMFGSVFMARQVNRTNLALQRTWEEMRTARDEAERASQAKSLFVSRMSHELRTPLNAILGFAQLLERCRLLPAEEGYVREINKAGRHLLELINQVLDLAKIEAGCLVLDRSDFDCVETVDTVASFIAESVYSKGLAMQVLASPDIPFPIKGDPSRLREVLINLLGNAVKFTEHGEVGIRVEPSEDGSRLLFRVWDTGVGISDAAVQRLFQPFVQADESITRKYGGTGLGLMICKELVVAMGGRIRVESKPGAGTAFCFEIPLELPEIVLERPRPLAGFTAHILTREELCEERLMNFAASMGAGTGVAHSRSEACHALDPQAEHRTLIVADMDFRDAMAGPTAFQATPGSVFLALAEREAKPALEQRCALQWVSIAPPVTYTRFLEAVEGIVSTAAARSTKQGERTTIPPVSSASEIRILVVEDNPVNQLVASGMLNTLGLRAEVANNGAEALQRLREKPYDIVFMDVEMPVMDGYTATRTIRNWEGAAGRSRTPVIAMTANVLSDDQARCIAAGMDDHLAKPLELDRLASLIKVWAPCSDHNAA
ncbi:MAG: ATP-binding protein [Syntrophobacteraceae bacterium]